MTRDQVFYTDHFCRIVCWFGVFTLIYGKVTGVMPVWLVSLISFLTSHVFEFSLVAAFCYTISAFTFIIQYANIAEEDLVDNFPPDVAGQAASIMVAYPSLFVYYYLYHPYGILFLLIFYVTLKLAFRYLIPDTWVRVVEDIALFVIAEMVLGWGTCWFISLFL